MSTVEECEVEAEAVVSDVIDVDFHEELTEQDLLIQDIAKAQEWRRKTLLDWEAAKFQAKEAKEIHEGACASLDELVNELTGKNIRPLFEKARAAVKPEPTPEPDDDDFADDLDEDDDAGDGRHLTETVVPLPTREKPLSIEGPAAKTPAKRSRKKEGAAT